MTKYETVAAYSVKEGAAVDSTVLNQKFVDLISENANLVDVKEWGVRKLAYAINYERDAAYYVYTYEAEEDFVAELERVYGITDGVLRWLTVKAFETTAAEETAEAGEAEAEAEAEAEEAPAETPAEEVVVEE